MATFIGLIPSKYTIYALYGTFGHLHLPNCRFYNFCICILIEWGRASPSCVFLLFFCVHLPVRANGSLAFVGLVALSFPSWPSWQYTFSFQGQLKTLAWYHIIHLSDRHLPAFSLAFSSCSALTGGRTWRISYLPSHFSCIHGRDTGHHCRYGCLFPFWCGSALIFFLCKGSPSVIRQVPVAQLLIPTQIFRQPSAFSS